MVEPYWKSSDGRHVIYCGDCRTILSHVGKVDLCLTDPPYAHKHIDGGGFAAASRFYRDGALDGLNDFVLSDYADCLIECSPMLIAFHSRDLIPAYASLSEKTERKYDLHFWWKPNAIPFTANTWKSDVEYIALIWEKKPGWVQCSQEVHSKVWQAPINRDDSHPAAKPIGLLEKYIRVLDAQTIVDPFCGSGTTLAAARRMGRRSIGVEIEKKYCDIAVRRMEAELAQPYLFEERKPDVQLEFPSVVQ